MTQTIKKLFLVCCLVAAISAHAGLGTITDPVVGTAKPSATNQGARIGWGAPVNNNGMMSSMSVGTITDPTPATETYTYNYLDQRVSKTVLGVTTFFAYDQQGQILGEYFRNGSPLREYVYLNGERVAMFDYSSGIKQTIYLANNHVGQMQYAWNSSGAIVDTRVQAPFGETSSETLANGLTPLRFPGMYSDTETGYNYNNQRYYDPSIGAYPTPDRLDILGRTNDPELLMAESMGVLRLPAGMQYNHPYMYAFNNPVNYWDFTGLLPDICGMSKKECRERLCQFAPSTMCDMPCENMDDICKPPEKKKEVCPLSEKPSDWTSSDGCEHKWVCDGVRWKLVTTCPDKCPTNQ